MDSRETLHAKRGSWFARSSPTVILGLAPRSWTVARGLTCVGPDLRRDDGVMGMAVSHLHGQFVSRGYLDVTPASWRSHASTAGTHASCSRCDSRLTFRPTKLVILGLVPRIQRSTGEGGSCTKDGLSATSTFRHRCAMVGTRPRMTPEVRGTRSARKERHRRGRHTDSRETSFSKTQCSGFATCTCAPRVPSPRPDGERVRVRGSLERMSNAASQPPARITVERRRPATSMRAPFRSQRRSFP
jgi:hypothetical protein